MPVVNYTVANGEIIAENRGGVRKCYVPDPLGSTRALLDSSQNITDTFDYWPYGEVKTRTGTTATPFQFVGTLGYYQDSGSRTYVRARTLRTDLGRWMTEDPEGDRSSGDSPAVYSRCSPVALTDRTGLDPCDYCKWITVCNPYAGLLCYVLCRSRHRKKKPDIQKPNECTQGAPGHARVLCEECLNALYQECLKVRDTLDCYHRFRGCQLLCTKWGNRADIGDAIYNCFTYDPR